MDNTSFLSESVPSKQVSAEYRDTTKPWAELWYAPLGNASREVESTAGESYIQNHMYQRPALRSGV